MPKQGSRAWLYKLLVVVLGTAVLTVVAVVAYRIKHLETEAVSVAAVSTTAPAPTQASTDPAPAVTATVDTAAATATLVATAAPHTSLAAPRAVRTGTLRTFAVAAGKPVFVDGRQGGVGGPRITTVCGRHTVVVGTGKPRSVDIPCDGSVLTVGTPNGK